MNIAQSVYDILHALHYQFLEDSGDWNSFVGGLLPCTGTVTQHIMHMTQASLPCTSTSVLQGGSDPVKPTFPKTTTAATTQVTTEQTQIGRLIARYNRRKCTQAFLDFLAGFWPVSFWYQSAYKLNCS